MNPFIIAEFCSNVAKDWNFDRWCWVARGVNADAVKVQIFRATHFPEAEQASKHPLEFPRERFADFVKVAHYYGVQAGASVFDADAVERY